ncbi:MAG: bifunctional diaminohydroxyphosphoribosylaminopyrimidine deaminase/5-amino-6-(5-phosphoribosylamino)uracil reductase RibD [Chloroflexi bacterium]|nr:bifunctional diaminohydroxyphosphoribosylaminopyrimidine deaminase/5-amino-6-(5-phosphoribosylamino)uracil reductase RibD [Chloroflexota bacterium]
MWRRRGRPPPPVQRLSQWRELGPVQPLDFLNAAAASGREWLGRTSPRPAVGAVVVRDGQIIGQSATAPGTGPHAEAQALEQAGALARGADLYTTLEPCRHHGQTPPCTEAIVAAGIGRCFYAYPDPNPAATGGAHDLAAAGIETARVAGCDAAFDGLKGYLHHTRTGRPWVIAKWAMSLDGRVALPAGQRGYLSSPQSLSLVHRRRAEVDAIVVGSGTVLADDPRLTVRSGIPVSRQPLRVVLDGRARLPADAAMLGMPGKTICFVGAAAPPERCAALVENGCFVQIQDDPPRADPTAVLQRLGSMGIQSVLLEGGPTTIGSFLAAQLINEIEVFLCPVLVGDPASPAALPGLPEGFLPPGLELLESGTVGPDLWLRARTRDSIDWNGEMQPE